ncbi:MAG: hypothetical protein P1U78_03880 [Alcanivoracaceae bacterium]|nr:hypothetical protein [Alcanivoracaceae bacterium]
MRRITVCLFSLSFLGLVGCATPLNSLQQREYVAMENAGVLVEEKDPTTGAVLGILPGFGSFYVREPGYGIVNLLFWPFSVLWDPVSGYEGSKAINYDITRHKLGREMKAELSELEVRLAVEQLSVTEYLIEKRKIEDKYAYE